MERFLFVIGIMLITMLIVGVLYFGLTPTGRSVWNQYRTTMHKVDDRITDEQRMQVENMCYSMMTYWDLDALAYTQYKDIDPERAEVAKSSANRMADRYNEYIFKNGYVFQGNMPNDIYAVSARIE